MDRYERPTRDRPLRHGSESLVGQGQIRATGVGGHVANLAVIAASFATQPAAASLFYGSSLLVAAARGYGACELFAISNWILERNDQIGCPVFYPLDYVEERRLR